jgi:hypothetical protein
MVQCIAIAAALISAGIADSPPSKDKPPATARVEAPDDSGEALAKYNGLKEKTPDTAAAQWKLGIWCEQHGLKAEAYVHFTAVVRLDPRRDAAWRKLGLKKSGGRWLTDEQLAEENEQRKAEKVWAPRLRKLHKDIHGTGGAKKRDEAQAALDAITDAHVIPSVYREFSRGQLDQTILIQILAQIEKPLSSKVLAMLTVYGSTPVVRRQATEILRGRPVNHFLELLVGLMSDPLKYEVRPVGGPGSPGVLFVEGQRFNVSRYYAPPPPPDITPGPGDIISVNQYGMPTILRPTGVGVTTPVRGVPGSKTVLQSTTIEQYAEISPLHLMMEAQRAAAMAQTQLEADVRSINAINRERKQLNDLVIAVAKDATGKDRGNTPQEWRQAIAVGNNLSKSAPSPLQKPTLPELVPLAYNPVFAPIGFMNLTRTNLVVDS